jgi:hypothetical protein
MMILGGSKLSPTAAAVEMCWANAGLASASWSSRKKFSLQLSTEKNGFTNPTKQNINFQAPKYYSLVHIKHAVT